MADQVLYSGVACITDLMVKEGLINLDFADVRAIMRGMGKAMMGTGQATGDRRAILAAEAAIANPLLDDVSMKGARGLLISITGGNDLTLYEVDEAATRIREEVDQEANIILGATFDETLEGVIRVSVVATGIDGPAEVREEISATEKRIAEVAERLRAEARARVAHMMPASAPIAQPAAPLPLRAAEPALQAYATQPAAPVAEAPRPSNLHPDVTIAPTAPRANLAADLDEESRLPRAGTPAYEASAPRPAAFIPPAAERVVRPQRMPDIEELPRPAQEQLRMARGEPAPAPAAPVRPMTLLQRLAAVGLGRRDETSDEVAAPEPLAAPTPVREASPSPVHAEYGRRPVQPAAPARAAQGQLDPHGRVANQACTIDDDHLEIPAFLRRQGT